jgi:hypothetical protein
MSHKRTWSPFKCRVMDGGHRCGHPSRYFFCNDSVDGLQVWGVCSDHDQLDLWTFARKLTRDEVMVAQIMKS